MKLLALWYINAEEPSATITFVCCNGWEMSLDCPDFSWLTVEPLVKDTLK